MAKIIIIGAGAMGSALTVPLIQNGHVVNLWGTELDNEIISDLKQGKPHPKHKCNLPSEVNAFYENELEKAMEGTDLIIMAITSDALGKVFKRVVPFLHEGMIIGSVSKGFEHNNKNKIVILPELLKEILPDKLKEKIPFVVIGGPCKAIEVIWKSPTSVTYSSENIENAEYMKKLLRTDVYNVETNNDVVGTEVCAAMKNAYAVSLGMAEGFKKTKGLLHNNTKSALFTFAVSEMALMVTALGGSYKSAIGLPGMGDLEVTGEAGRNRILGEVIGEGMKASEAIEKMRIEGITVEGYAAIKFGYNLVKQLTESDKLTLKELPLLEGLYKILYEDMPCYENIKAILTKCTGFYK